MLPVVPNHLLSHVNGKMTTAVVMETNQNGAHRDRPPFTPSASLDIEEYMQ